MKLVSVLLLSFLSLNSFALKKSSSVNFYGAKFTGFEQIGLKRLLRDDLSRQDLARWDISTIQISAKSLDGNSIIKLVSGRGELSDFKVPGTPENFESQSIGFSTHTFNVPSYALRDGALKLVLIGDIKVNVVDISLSSSPSYNFRDVEDISFKEESTFRVNKIIGSSQSIRVHGHIEAIRLTGVKEKVSVHKVEIIFADGQRIELNEMDATLKPGQSVAFRIDRELDMPIEKILVDGVSSKLFGSRGSIKVEFGQR